MKTCEFCPTSGGKIYLVRCSIFCRSIAEKGLVLGPGRGGHHWMCRACINLLFKNRHLHTESGSGEPGDGGDSILDDCPTPELFAALRITT